MKKNKCRPKRMALSLGLFELVDVVKLLNFIFLSRYLASIGEFTNIDDDDMSRPEIDFMKNTKNNTGKVPEIQKLMGDRIYDYYLFGYVDKE